MDSARIQGALFSGIFLMTIGSSTLAMILPALPQQTQIVTATSRCAATVTLVDALLMKIADKCSVRNILAWELEILIRTDQGTKRHNSVLDSAYRAVDSPMATPGSTGTLIHANVIDLKFRPASRSKCAGVDRAFEAAIAHMHAGN